MQTEDDLVSFDVLYSRLRQLCGRQLREERAGHTLDGTALANEVFLRLRQLDERRLAAPLISQRWFLAMASVAIRQSVVDYARGRQRLKRGGGWARVDLDPVERVSGSADARDAILVVDQLLTELAALSPLQSHIAQLRYFGGLTFDQIALVVELSESAVRREWNFAQAWLGSRPEAVEWSGQTRQRPS